MSELTSDNARRILEEIRQSETREVKRYDALQVVLKDLAVISARIEERVAAIRQQFDEHELKDEKRFRQIEDHLTTLKIDSEVAKNVSAKEGGKYGIITSGSLLAISEVIRRWFGF